ncbi:MAG: type IV secretory system conjugative DNA transfer family protein [Maricaulaceae bacterium]
MRPYTPNFITHALSICCLCVGYGWLLSAPHVHPYLLRGVRYLIFAALAAFLFKLLAMTPRMLAHRKTKKSTGLKGTASWATRKQVRRLSTNKRKGFLAGLMDGSPVWLPIESSGLVLSPAGGGKTVGFVIPALMSHAGSMIVADLKGTLAAITRRHRAKRHKNKIFILNPAGRFGSILGAGAKFNPLGVLKKNWDDPERQKFLLSDAIMLAKQMLPEPVKEGQNTFFRNGSRKLLVFGMIYLVVTTGGVTLSALLRLLSDLDTLADALFEASKNTALNCDLARMANDVIGKMSEGRPEQLESFREGALQVLEPFAPSGVLADSTESSDFYFAMLRKTKATVYIVCDPTQMDAFAIWLGLVMEAAKTELIRNTDGGDVTLMVDEATNFKFGSLPALLTSAREFKLRIWVVVQELEMWAHVYGREALDTLLSQTELKIIHGSRSHKTCELVSNMLGEYSSMATSYNTGRSVLDPVQRSTSEVGRKRLTADEVARFDKAVVFYKNNPPMPLDVVGYHEVAPWRNQADPNPLFGKKKYKGKVRLRV